MATYRSVSRAACLVTLCLFTASLSAQQDTRGAEAEVGAMWEAWFQARKAGDRAALERMMAPEFTSTHSNAVVRSRDEYIRLWTEPRSESQPKLQGFELTGTKIRIYGDTAIVNGGVTILRSLRGEQERVPLVVTATLVKNEGRWQAVALHISLVPAPE